jgi:hypothetical protein
VIKYRQLIRPGQSGRDVKAVKIAYKRMGIDGAGGLTNTKKAGPAFVRVTKRVQRNHRLRSDGIYGKATHEVVAPHFTAYCRWLYRTAKIRKPPQPPVPTGSAKEMAEKLLEYYKIGRYRADNSADLPQIQKTAKGEPVWSQAGYYVHIDPKTLQVLVWLIEEGFKIGTYAICSDHGYDGTRGHAGGHAVDISSVNGISIAAHTPTARDLTLKLATMLNRAPVHLRPWQLICDGYGYVHDDGISSRTIPNAGFYGYTTMSEHRNHIHVGF